MEIQTLLDFSAGVSMGAPPDRPLVVTKPAYMVVLALGVRNAVPVPDLRRRASLAEDAPGEADKILGEYHAYTQSIEQSGHLLGGILVLEAKDKAEAVKIMSRHPGIRMGSFEVRPANEAFMAQHPVLRKQKE